MARPPQTRPTKAEIASYYRTLKSAAKGGDVLACAELIKIDIMTKQQEQPPVSELAQAGQQMLDSNEELREVVQEIIEALNK